MPLPDPHPVADPSVQRNFRTLDQRFPVQSADIGDDSIDSQHYVDGSIDTAHLAADAVDGTKLADDAVGGEHIEDDAVDSQHYVDGSIDNAHLASDSVDGSKIADDSVDSEHYVDGSIDTAHIGDLQVTTGKIANGAVTPAKEAITAEGGMKFIRGSVDTTGPTGTIDAGGGFTINYNGTGDVTVNFSTSFSTAPSVSLGTNADAVTFVAVPTTGGFRALTRNESAGVLSAVSAKFNFLAIGPA